MFKFLIILTLLLNEENQEKKRLALEIDNNIVAGAKKTSIYCNYEMTNLRNIGTTTSYSLPPPTDAHRKRRPNASSSSSGDDRYLCRMRRGCNPLAAAAMGAVVEMLDQV